MINQILKGLNAQQKEAVRHDKGPLLIIAGAGTGKTSVITRRIAHLIETKKALPEEIVALTFTEKAAANMEEGVDILVPYGYTNVWISTFHAFGDRILRENALIIGLDPNFKVLTRPEQIIFFREHLFEFPLNYFRPLSDPAKFIEALVVLFSRAKDEDTSPKEYLDYAKNLENKLKENPDDEELKELIIQQREIADSYAKYQELTSKNNRVDFGDQVYLCLKLLREHPLILKNYQRQFKYILVDEFQDTNYAQFELVKLLAGKDKNLTVVGDDDQCLPPCTLIETHLGRKRIENITAGERVITGVGRGYVSISNVTKVFKRKKIARFLTFKTEKGYKITVTDNHKMFCFVPPVPYKKDIYYVYLMCRMNLGWRIGVTNDLAGRLRLERSADKIIGLRGFYSEREAYYYEVLWSLRYGIPTACFKEREGLRLAGKWLDRLYSEIDVYKNVMRLARDLRIDLNSHHICLDGVTRGSSKRVKIHLEMCYRKYRSKAAKNNVLQKPAVSHIVHLQTSQESIIKKLEKAGIVLHPAKKGKRFRFANADIRKVGDLAYRLCAITDGILESKFSVGTMNIQYKSALIMSASNVLIGHYLPVMEGSRIIYDRVINISEKTKEEVVYDLEIERTHNFIANNIVVHNSIYKFRGAAISNILNFMDTYKDAKKVVLTKNYRSTQIILDRAYTLIKHNNP
ncbi:MAG: hypothetical protein FJZ16_07140, partial [Candidatus Omnitrophica bacterium]|nr:hypothetical protein [Candidatus Omnitrophota bacterium]